MKSSASLDWWAKILTAFMFGVVGFLIYEIIMINESNAWIGLSFGVVTLTIVIFWCYMNSVKEYVIEGHTLIVQRIKGQKTFDLNALTSVENYSEVKHGMTWRTMGNGGLFGYFGSFSNKGVGDFSMYATRQKPLWILTLGKQKIAISPDDASFITALQELVKAEV